MLSSEQVVVACSLSSGCGSDGCTDVSIVAIVVFEFAGTGLKLKKARLKKLKQVVKVQLTY